MTKLPSNHPHYRKKKKVQKEFYNLLVWEGYMSLFPPIIRTDKRWLKTRARIVRQALEFVFDVPEPMVGSINIQRLPPSSPH